MIVPTILNTVLIGMYFSGVKIAQQIVAPSVHGLPIRSWREYGLVEQLQNVFLLSIIVFFIVQLWQRKQLIEKAVFFVGAMVITFLFLEEIDYGIHYYELYIGHEADVAEKARNWHNKGEVGEHNVSYLKRVIDLITICWFCILPLLARKRNLGRLHALIPSIWFIVVFTISLVFSNVAHYFQSIQFDVINGQTGNLLGNISEFRETITYYAYLLYALQLVKTPSLFAIKT